MKNGVFSFLFMVVALDKRLKCMLIFLWSPSHPSVLIMHWIFFWWLLSRVFCLFVCLATPHSTQNLSSLLLLLLLVSRFSRVQFCDPIDGSPPGSSIPGILQARTLEWVAISFSNACTHAKSLQSCPTLCKPMDSSPPGSSVHGIL